jgi:hypothetical protein
MNIESIAFISGIVFVFIAIIGGGITGKDTHIPKLGASGRLALGFIGMVLCLPFIVGKLQRVPNSAPVGTIIAFYGKATQKPNGYLVCDGDGLSESEHPLLYKHLIQANPRLLDSNKTLHLPNLQGEFLRGLDLGRGIDAGRELGGEQFDSLKSHVHLYYRDYSKFGERSGLTAAGDGGEKLEDTKPYPTENDGKETRPRNIAVLYLIRAD